MNIPATTRTLESRARLSESIIWEQQARLLAELGADAWKSIAETKPTRYYTYLADLYADLIIGIMRDITRRHPSSKETLQILELGSASGHFAWLLCNALDQRLEDLPIEKIDYTLTLSDPHQSCRDYWSAQAQLKEYFEVGKINWNEPGRAGELPLIVIANGHFSSLPADAYYIENGKLYENRLTVETKQTDQGETFDFYYDPIPIDPPSGHPLARPGIAKGGAGWLPYLEPSNLPQNGTFTIPTGALATIEALKTQANNELILLTADFMYLSTDGMDQRPADNLFTNGLISTPLNAHALTHYLHNSGWESLTPQAPINPFQTMVTTCSSQDWPELTSAWNRSQAPLTADDHINLCTAIAANEAPTIRQILSLFHLAHNDPGLLPEYANLLKSQLAKVIPDEIKLLTESLSTLWRNTYRNGIGPDIAFELAKLCYELDDYENTVAYLHHSINDYGEASDSCYNLALCYKQIGDTEEFREWLTKALVIEPDYVPAKQLQNSTE